MENQNIFNPTEIIFAGNSSCNLSCAHCFVTRTGAKLTADEAVGFMKSARASSACTIEKIGFSGGEPFLYPEFLETVIKEAVNLDFMFDRLMTNGVWWKTEEELECALQKVYDAGFDGKIGLSWDYFHSQDFEKIFVFIGKVLAIFGGDSLEIQSVVPYDRRNTDFVKRADTKLIDEIKELTKRLNLVYDFHTNFFDKTGLITLESCDETSRKCCLEKMRQKICENKASSNSEASSSKEKIFIRIFRTPETFQCSDGRGWNSRKWFKEDYCAGPGQILYVHSSGKIAPCCGFANENNRLILGTVRQTYDEIVLNAEVNPLLNVCFKTGLLNLAKEISKKQDSTRKTNDPCTFCDYVCKYELV